MDEHRARTEQYEIETTSNSLASRWLAITAVLPIVAICAAVGYGYYQQTLVGHHVDAANPVGVR